MPLNFRSFACDVTSCPFSDVPQREWSNEAILDETLYGTNKWMGEIMERAKYFKAKFLWHIRTLFFVTDITEDQEQVPFLKDLS